MFGKFGEILGALSDVSKIKAKLKKLKVVGRSGSGMVEVVMRGDRFVESVSIDEGIVGNKGKIEREVREAVNDALNRITKELMSSLGADGLPF